MPLAENKSDNSLLNYIRSYVLFFTTRGAVDMNLHFIHCWRIIIFRGDAMVHETHRKTFFGIIRHNNNRHSRLN